MFDLVLTIIVIILVLMFVTLLVKLNPSGETKHDFDEDLVQETSNPKSIVQSETQPHQTAPTSLYGYQSTSPEMHTVNSWQKTESGKSTVKSREEASRIVVSASMGGTSEVEEESETASANKPLEKPEASEPPSVPFIAAQKSGDKCPHKFGYLGGLPKNRAIPDECFGCPKIVECLVSKKES